MANQNPTGALSTFLGTILSTSAFETARTINNIDSAQLQTDFQNIKFSNLGTPVLDYVILTLDEDETPTKINNYASSSNNKFVTGVTNIINNYSINPKSFFLDNVEITLTQTKNIIRTAVNGFTGTVKQFYSDGSYIITLNGQLNGTMPFQDDVRNLRNFQKISTENERFKITSRYLNDIFKIEYVIVSDYSFTPSTEYSNVILFNISLESDEQINIISEVL